MMAGLLPSLAGDAYNDWNNSNGAWIRTEIWASLAPACPDIAMKYAMGMLALTAVQKKVLT